MLTLDLGEIAEPCELVLNYKTEPGGNVRVELEDLPEHTLTDAVPLEGDSTGGVAAWTSGTRIVPQTVGSLTAHIHLERAEVFAYELR